MSAMCTFLVSAAGRGLASAVVADMLSVVCLSSVSIKCMHTMDNSNSVTVTVGSVCVKDNRRRLTEERGFKERESGGEAKKRTIAS